MKLEWMVETRMFELFLERMADTRMAELELLSCCAFRLALGTFFQVVLKAGSGRGQRTPLPTLLSRLVGRTAPEL